MVDKVILLGNPRHVGILIERNAGVFSVCKQLRVLDNPGVNADGTAILKLFIPVFVDISGIQLYKNTGELGLSAFQFIKGQLLQRVDTYLAGADFMFRIYDFNPESFKTV